MVMQVEAEIFLAFQMPSRLSAAELGTLCARYLGGGAGVYIQFLVIFVS
jgi:hypothetical protein